MSRNPLHKIDEMIYVVRNQKIMLDSDLAELYGVKTKVLNQAVKRNVTRFPEDFMFQLSYSEYSLLKKGKFIDDPHGGLRTMPFAFTESGVAMLSSVLSSEKAIQVNIYIMRIFISLRHMLTSEALLVNKISKLEEGTDRLFKIVFERLDNLEADTKNITTKRNKIGFKDHS